MRKRRFWPFLLKEGTVSNQEIISTDPMGSYTGLPEDPNEVPVQDADDL